MSILATSQTVPLTAASEPFATEISPTPSLRGSGTTTPLHQLIDTDPNTAALPNMILRQDPFSLTLDAPALLVLSFLLLLAMHALPRPLLESTILALPCFLLIHNDYRNFLALGPGGTPSTIAGYARLAWFRLFALRDPFAPLPVPSTPTSPSTSSSATPRAGILAPSRLPYRPGPTPTVAGLAPQRQLNQHGSADATARLTAALSLLARREPRRFGVATSCLEKHGFALFARHPVNVCGNGEVCHVHSSDGSMHMNLHPEDIAQVLKLGWGQRHPLAWGRRLQGKGGKGKGWWDWEWLPRVTSPVVSFFPFPWV